MYIHTVESNVMSFTNGDQNQKEVLIVIFRGRRVEMEYGFGSVFTAVFSRALTLRGRGGKYLGKKPIRAGLVALDDVNGGYRLKKRS